MLEYFNLPDFNTYLIDTAIVKNHLSFVGFIKLLYISYWQIILHDSQKIAFHRSFKTDHTSSNYLSDLTRGTAGRREFVKLRINNHKLIIGHSRYNQTIRDKIVIFVLFMDPIKKKTKFTLFFCIVLNTRNNCYTIKSRLIPNVTQLPAYVLINELRDSSNSDFISTLFY